jgi:hypothetical protein
MEISSSVVTDALKVSIQVLSSHKRPLLEVYHQVHNRFGPANEMKIRFQDIFVQFSLVNIGGERAENIKLSISGDLRKNKPMQDFGGSFRSIVPQLAPGQTHFLFRFADHDFNIYPEGGGKPIGVKTSSFTITVEYDAPKGFINWFLALPSRIRCRRRFVTTYTFSPEMIAGDLPPEEYAP